MMFPKLESIKQVRLRLGITQRKLAALSGVSSSMINQIESNRCKPSYETAKRIFEALANIEGHSSPKAGEICSGNLLVANPSESIIEAAEKLRKSGYSQLPIFENGRPIGMVSEDGIMHAIVNGEAKDVKNRAVSSIMEPCPPIVDKSVPSRTLIPLMKFSKAILVADQGKTIGIVTVSDVLKTIEP